VACCCGCGDKRSGSCGTELVKLVIPLAALRRDVTAYELDN
jgi:hypothetical protein